MNWRSANALIERMLRGALVAAEDKEFLRGIGGNGRPLGVLASKALLKVARAQAANVTYADLVALEEKLLEDGEAIWVVNPRVIPKLRQMDDTAGHLIWQERRPRRLAVHAPRPSGRPELPEPRARDARRRAPDGAGLLRHQGRGRRHDRGVRARPLQAEQDRREGLQDCRRRSLARRRDQAGGRGDLQPVRRARRPVARGTARPRLTHRILKALDAFGFGSVALSIQDFIEPNKVIQLGYLPVRIDIVTSISGVSWAEAYQTRVAGKYGDMTVYYIGRKQFVINKRSVGRKKDLADLEALSEE